MQINKCVPNESANIKRLKTWGKSRSHKIGVIVKMIRTCFSLWRKKRCKTSMDKSVIEPRRNNNKTLLNQWHRRNRAEPTKITTWSQIQRIRHPFHNDKWATTPMMAYNSSWVIKRRILPKRRKVSFRELWRISQVRKISSKMEGMSRWSSLGNSKRSKNTWARAWLKSMHMTRCKMLMIHISWQKNMIPKGYREILLLLNTSFVKRTES